MRYAETMPINIIILSQNVSAECLPQSISGSRLFNIQLVSSIELLLCNSIVPSPELVVIHSTVAAPVSYESSIISIKSVLSVPCIFMADSISAEQGEQLLASGFSDYISMRGITEEALHRSTRLALTAQTIASEIISLRDLDPLTLTPNRSCFYKILATKLSRDAPLALMIIDVDDFKAFNHRMGHTVGDQVLRDLCSRIQKHAPSNSLYRIGGDEFAVILEANSEAQLKADTESFLSGLTLTLFAGFDVCGQDNILGTSIGVAYRCPDGEIDTLINQANQARSRAKRMHACSFSIYQPELDTPPPYQGLLESDIWTAIKLNQFELYYQPRINLKTGNIVGAEALMRWNHPAHGLIMPNDFIPLSERTGQIVPMGFWAIQQAGKDLRKIKAAGYQLSKLGVNLSFRQFQHELLAQTIQRIVEVEQIDTRILELELTESSLFSDDQHVQHSIEQLCKIGIDFSLDDFGTGYSSFALLQKLPISALKIDRSFITMAPSSADDAEIVRAIISLAHNLHKSVIAEGVETQEQLDFLIENDCDQVQGFLFSPPVPLDSFLNMLRTD